MEIVEDIEDKIKSNDFRKGEKLPSERKLAIRYNVSRNVIREAITTLKTRGLVKIKTGKGIFVIEPNEEIASKSLENVFRSYKITKLDVLEVREELELIIVKKAIQSITQPDLDKLKEIYYDMEKCRYNILEYIKKDEEFHLTLAKSTQNFAFYILIHSFFGFTESELFALTETWPSSISIAQKHHGLIIKAIEESDEELASNIISKHMDTIRGTMQIQNENDG